MVDGLFSVGIACFWEAQGISAPTYHQKMLASIVSYLLHFTLKSATHALALKPKPLVVRSTDRGRDPGSL